MTILHLDMVDMCPSYARSLIGSSAQVYPGMLHTCTAGPSVMCKHCNTLHAAMPPYIPYTTLYQTVYGLCPIQAGVTHNAAATTIM
jgi:hypothetical protein